MVLDVGHMVAGVSGGVASTIALHPLDLIKIRMQVETSRDGISMLEFIKSVLRKHGVRGMYAGMSPNVVASGLAWGSYFFSYNEIKILMRTEDRQMLSPLQHGVAAVTAGSATLVATNPLWVIKTRMCSNAAGEVPYKGIIDGLLTIYRTEGLHALYKGLLPGLVGTSHGAVQFAAYEELKYLINNAHGLHADAKLSTAEYFYISALSKVLAQAITYPYQVVRSRLQNNSSVMPVPLTKIVVDIWKFEGIRGFYKGLTPSLVRVVPASSITIVVYEHVWRLFHPE